jgi:putative spermidine/putrescine transport system substrate-binding protein
MRVKTFRKVVLLAATALMAAATVASADETLTVAGLGGTLQKDLSKTLFEPAAKMAGVELREQSHDGIAGVRVQVQSGAPSWDVAHMGADDCTVGAAEGLFEPIDYSVIDAGGIPEQGRGKEWISTNSYSVVMAWRKDKYGDKPPKDWKDFWNVEAFPGRRALSVYPPEMMEIALLADGVARDKVYPIDAKRSLDALKRLKPNVAVWWTSGAQSAQLIKDGEVDMLAIWGSRVANVIADGAPVAFTYQDGLYGYGCMAILKGSKKVAQAQKFIAGVISPEVQARIPTMMGYYGPTNQKAFEVGNFSADIIAKSNTSPENISKQVLLEATWWAEHMQDVAEDYKNMMNE